MMPKYNGVRVFYNGKGKLFTKYMKEISLSPSVRLGSLPFEGMLRYSITIWE
jgi:hypothetical protein